MGDETGQGSDNCPDGGLKLYNIEEAAEVLGMTPRAVANQLRDGRIHGIKIGRGWRIRQEALDAYQNRNAGRYTMQEAADVLGVSRATLYRYVKDDGLPYVAEGREHYITRETLERFIDGKD